MSKIMAQFVISPTQLFDYSEKCEKNTSLFEILKKNVT